MRRFGIDFEVCDPAPTTDRLVSAFPSVPGLYLHVPFCRTLCPFCPYNKVRFQVDLVARYFSALATEVDLYLGVLPGPFPSLYIGGGTPTLCLDELEPLLGRIEVSGERAIEVLPGHMTPEGAARMQALGFDFVSIGVQSFDQSVLRHLRRSGTGASNRRAVETALEWFSCVDVDLIFDTVYDDPRTLLGDLEICFEYGVDQVSTYPLMRFGYTPFGKGRDDRRQEHRLLRLARELATEHGYERRSVWTFNKAGSPAYTSITRPYYLGLGAGAASFAGRLFFVNHFGLEQYRTSLVCGHLPVARIARLPAPAAAAYRFFWQSYTGRIPLRTEDPWLSHPVDLALADLARIARWVERDDGSLALTQAGYDRYHDLERWVTYHLIEPLWAEMMTEHETFPTPVAVEVGQS